MKEAMAQDPILSAPHWKSQGHYIPLPPTLKRAFVQQHDVSCNALMQRHRFLLTALVLLFFLCTVYLYFAVTLGNNKFCSGLIGDERELCRLKHVKESFMDGKLKLL